MAKFAKREGIMLAYPAEQKRIDNFPLLQVEDGKYERQFFHQPKLNGERARTEWFAGKPELISSYGNAFSFMDRIQADLGALSAYMEEDLLYDGEMYVHGWSREEVDSALRRTKNRNPKVDQLQYHIFDIQCQLKQYARLHKLGTLEQVIHELGLETLKIVPYGVCNDSDWIHHCAHYCEEGYEGIMLRSPFADYEFKRTTGLLKFKPTETDLYEIVTVNEAISMDGQPKGMVGSFTVKATDIPDAVFDVGAGKLNHAQRIHYWCVKDWCIGRMLLVKHELLRTTNSVPIAAVTVDIV